MSKLATSSESINKDGVTGENLSQKIKNYTFL